MRKDRNRGRKKMLLKDPHVSSVSCGGPAFGGISAAWEDAVDSYNDPVRLTQPRNPSGRSSLEARPSSFHFLVLLCSVPTGTSLAAGTELADLPT